MLGYGFLTILLKLTKTKADMITLLTVLIFTLQQMHIFVKDDPLDSIKMQSVFRYESLIQFMTFICTIGPFLPLRYYFPPVTFIYSVSFWATYYQSKKPDLCLGEITWQFVIYLSSCITSACIVQFALKEVLNVVMKTT